MGVMSRLSACDPMTASPNRPALIVWRVILGFVLAPVIPCVVIIPLGLASFGYGPSLIDFVLHIAAWTSLAVIIALPASLLVGVPLFFVFRWRRWTSLKSYALGGALVGSLVVAFLPALFFLTYGVISGAVAALTLWVCAYGDRRSFAITAVILGLLVALVLTLNLLAPPTEI